MINKDVDPMGCLARIDVTLETPASPQLPSHVADGLPSPTVMSAEAVYKRLVQRAKSIRRLRGLNVIDAVCRATRESDGANFRASAIARLSQRQNGPSSKAIRNRTGKPYRILIAAHRREAASLSRECAPVDPWSDVLDPHLRARIHVLEARMREMQGQLVRAHTRRRRSQRRAQPQNR